MGGDCQRHQLVHGAGFGVWRWPPLPLFMLVEAVIFALVGVGVCVLHLYLLSVGYRTLKTGAVAG